MYNFELSNFMDKLREKHKISYNDYLKYRGMADTLEMENQKLKEGLTVASNSLKNTLSTVDLK